ncbi:MAG TPA: alpha/beta hydrolase [Pseudolabrys sp.]|nr:alpha/beta hydrolase [Pseudolabrys sp.]
MPREPAFGTRRRADFRSIATQVDAVAMYSVVSEVIDTSWPMPLVVLVHGLGLSQRYMMPAACELSRDCRVYVPDQPGFGGSGHPEKVLDMKGLADALARWMPAVGLQRATFVGNSQGCQIIAQLAVRHPSMVAAAVLQGPTAPPKERTWLRQYIRWRQNGRYNPPSLDPVTWDEYKKSGYFRVLRTFQYSLDDHIEDQLPHIQAPTLVVRGEYDPICPDGWARELASLLPKGQFVQLSGVAHTLCYTAPHQLSAAVMEFLAAIDVPRA